MIGTGGGRFDPHEPPIYFTVINAHTATIRNEHMLIALNDLGVIIEGKETTHQATLGLESEIELGHKVLLDSGVFWLTNRHARAHGVSMDVALGLHPDQIDGFGDLWDAYLSTVKKYEDGLWGYIELDQGGAERKKETRSRLEALGLRPIPVYHPINDGWDYFDEIASGYDRICVGNVVQASRPDRRRILATLWERKRRYPHLWIHVLGLTPNEMISTYPFNSCDSTSMGNLIRWRPQTMPVGMSALRKLAGPDDSYSYEKENDASYEKCLDVVFANGHFLTHTWRAQHECAAALCDDSPAVEDWEAPLR